MAFLMAQMALDAEQSVVIVFGTQGLLDSFYNIKLLLIFLGSTHKILLHEGEYLSKILTFCCRPPRFTREKGYFTYERIDRYLGYICR